LLIFRRDFDNIKSGGRYFEMHCAHVCVFVVRIDNVQGQFVIQSIRPLPKVAGNVVRTEANSV